MNKQLKVVNNGKGLLNVIEETSVEEQTSNSGQSIDTSFTLIPYTAVLSVVHNAVKPNFEVHLTGNLTLTVTGTSNGELGVVNLYFTSTQVATLNGVSNLIITGAGNMIPVYFTHDSDGLKWSTDAVVPLTFYANDAAADADATLLSGKYYKITGSRAVYQKP